MTNFYLITRASFTSHKVMSLMWQKTLHHQFFYQNHWMSLPDLERNWFWPNLLTLSRSKLTVCNEFLTVIFASEISNSRTMAQTKQKTFLIKRKSREREAGIKMHNANLFIYIHWSSRAAHIYGTHSIVRARSLFLPCLCRIGPQLLHQHICIIK